MTQAKSIYNLSIVVYIILAYLFSKFVNIHWVHIFNTLMLGSILYNILDWKYSCEEEGDNNENIKNKI